MMVNTNVYGYVTDGAVFCPGCTDARPGDEEGVTALFYLDDEDPHGLVCDACYSFIFEPVERHTPKPDGTCDYGCFSYCGDTESCSLHGPTIAERFIEHVVGEEDPATLSADALLTLFSIPSSDDIPVVEY